MDNVSPVDILELDMSRVSCYDFGGSYNGSRDGFIKPGELVGDDLFSRELIQMPDNLKKALLLSKWKNHNKTVSIINPCTGSLISPYLLTLVALLIGNVSSAIFNGMISHTNDIYAVIRWTQKKHPCIIPSVINFMERFENMAPSNGEDFWSLDLVNLVFHEGMQTMDFSVIRGCFWLFAVLPTEKLTRYAVFFFLIHYGRLNPKFFSDTPDIFGPTGEICDKANDNVRNWFELFHVKRFPVGHVLMDVAPLDIKLNDWKFLHHLHKIIREHTHESTADFFWRKNHH